jgi:hypothetical protein
MNYSCYQKGDIIVQESGKITIHLRECPRNVQVFFKRHHHVPCDPGHHHSDHLEWEVRKSGIFFHKYILVIKWKVHTLREIIWSVNY